MSDLVSGVIFRITLRATIGRRRALLFALPAVLMIGVSALLKAVAHSPVWPPEILGTFGFTVVIPLTALIIGTSVLGAEIDDGSVLHVLATPVRRHTVLISKYLVAVALTVVFAAIPEYLAATIATGPASRLTIGLLVGALVAAVVYNAAFIMLSVLTRRAVVVGLLYLLVWEGLLSNLVPAVRLLSAGSYSLSVATSIAHNTALNGHLALGTAIGLAVITTAVMLVFGIRRLAAFTIKGDPV
jgi:ABC-2 type transport system permease protein